MEDGRTTSAPTGVGFSLDVDRFRDIRSRQSIPSIAVYIC